MEPVSERFVLKVSAYGALVFAVIAMVWGVLGQSQMILFDGVYSLISVALSVGSLWSASYIQKYDFKRFPFGKEMLEPIIILLKNVVIIILCVFAFFNAVASILSGGQMIDPGMSALYALLATIGCLLVYRYLERRHKALLSGFIKAEAVQWKMDFFLSMAVLLGFLIAFGLNFTIYKNFVPYIDPVMVVLVSGYFIKVPMGLIKKQVREVMEMSPDSELKQEVDQIISATKTRYGFEEYFLRVSKVGSKLFVEVDYVVDRKAFEPTIEEMDLIRQEISDALQEVPYKKWLTISFTSDRKWAL
ncbi:cation diffusion facilitator family transporter [Litoribacter ruber]|uniref:Cation diffusion facilitator family transporter n=1 Tax=Litoribacter ruber TaxID=702568 RepID=A0AAP2G583_9BACT|nr:MULTISPECIES: cation diffusion facilitator family transporter [Litoribacter]MBS9524841.1 cation diffusion facilitator family transporter [Litoribacter alkaliphilus]MBT0812576.1 cation diffusion facilitator family transporter [Litoribacter ruber]